MRTLRSWLGILGTLATASVPTPAAAQPAGSEFQVNTYTTSDQLTVPYVGRSIAADASGNFVVVWHGYSQDGSWTGVFGQRYDSAGGALGNEFRVNSYTTQRQDDPSVAVDADGDFVVVWQSYGQDGTSWGVFGQRYDSGGRTLGSEFRVNSNTSSSEAAPVVASDASGNFVVVWGGLDHDGSGWGIFGQRYDSQGGTVGSEFRVNSYRRGYQTSPFVASDESGNFVVVWQSLNQDGYGYGVFGQRYASAGAPLGPEFRVSTHTPSFQGFPSIATGSSGDFVVAWQSFLQDGSYFGVFGQRFAGSGTPVGPEFQVNTFILGYQYVPDVASDASGNFVVTWMSYGEDGSFAAVFGRRYASSGPPLTSEFLVNTYTTYSQGFPSVAADSSGGFVVVWVSPPDGSIFGIFGQRYASSGSPFGPEFRVNTYTTSYQSGPAVAANSSGNFVVVWQSDTQDGSGYGVYGQRYSAIVPVELIRLGVE
jgi:hypothetical protein